MSIEYTNEVAVQPLDHLNVVTFEEVLEYALREPKVQILKVNLTMGSSIGENYCSQIYRAKVEYKVKSDEHEKSRKGTLSLIIKSMPQSAASEFLDDMHAFLKERIVFLEVLPRMEMFLKRGQYFGARLYHSLKLPVNTLIFEDLCSKGFEMASRELGMDEAHCCLVMERLAQFHAISMILAQKQPEIIKCFEAGMLSKTALERDNSFLMAYFGNNIAMLIDVTSNWPGFEGITKKLQTYAANLRDNLFKSQAPLPGEIKVLNHGDLWVNNILFKYDKARQVQDLIFVDYQMSIWGSPGIDINYFFYTSMQLDMLKYKREHLLRVYHARLCATLQEVGYDNAPTFEEVQQEVHRRMAFGFFANYGLFPTICMDKKSSSDNSLDNYMDPEFAKNQVKKMFSSKRLEQTLQYTLKYFDENGLWD